LILIERPHFAPAAKTFTLLVAVLLILSHFNLLPFVLSGALTLDAAAVLLVAFEPDIYRFLLAATLTDKRFCHGAHSYLMSQLW
jgi:hypothetical protein